MVSKLILFSEKIRFNLFTIDSKTLSTFKIFLKLSGAYKSIILVTILKHLKGEAFNPVESKSNFLY